MSEVEDLAVCLLLNLFSTDKGVGEDQSRWRGISHLRQEYAIPASDRPSIFLFLVAASSRHALASGFLQLLAESYFVHGHANGNLPVVGNIHGLARTASVVKACLSIDLPKTFGFMAIFVPIGEVGAVCRGRWQEILPGSGVDSRHFIQESKLLSKWIELSDGAASVAVAQDSKEFCFPTTGDLFIKRHLTTLCENDDIVFGLGRRAMPSKQT